MRYLRIGGYGGVGIFYIIVFETVKYVYIIKSYQN